MRQGERCGRLPSSADRSTVIRLKDERLKGAAAELRADGSAEWVEGVRDGVKCFLDTEYH